MERSVYFWEAGFDPGLGLALADVAPRLAAIGATHAIVKVGVDGRDGPILWTRAGAGLTVWDDRALRPLTDAGLTVIPFSYVTGGDQYPVERELQAHLDLFRVRPYPLLILNPETEWRDHRDRAGSFVPRRTNEQAAAYVERLRQAFRDAGLAVPAIGFSSVPTWADFPYEGFSRACDGPAYPQLYWPPRIADQVAAHRRRAAAGKAVVPILPGVPTGWDPRDLTWRAQDIVAQAQNALSGLDHLAGLSAWVMRGDFDYEALRQAYALLPEGAARQSFEAPPQSQPAAWHFTDGGKDLWVVGAFLSYWRANGGLPVFGLPVSPELGPPFAGAVGPDVVAIQYFERARLERHADRSITRGRVGAELAAALGIPG
jgi:hypothetical protein